MTDTELLAKARGAIRRLETLDLAKIPEELRIRAQHLLGSTRFHLQTLVDDVYEAGNRLAHEIHQLESAGGSAPTKESQVIRMGGLSGHGKP